MDTKQIQDLIKFVAKSGVNEVEIEQKDFKIVIKTGSGKKGDLPQNVIHQIPAMAQQVAPQVEALPPPAPAPTKKAETPAEDNSKYIEIKSPMIGTFYRRPSPDKDIFVNVGDDITSGKVICIIEAMKLFNEIEAEVSGKIVKILVDDSTPVEYDQPLFLVDPS